ncbi:hypothetical protein N7488_012354 [Penicillium malachiteum]|nr:hypothetical protein N7488_012354 [Penicillium malachiteum]
MPDTAYGLKVLYHLHDLEVIMAPEVQGWKKSSYRLTKASNDEVYTAPWLSVSHAHEMSGRQD